VLKDSSGNGHDGKIIGAKWVKVDDKLQGSMVPLAVAKNKVPSAGTPAKSHSALRFQNDSDRVILPLKHETAGDLTVEAWVTIDENSNRPLRFIANGSSLTSFGIGYSKAEGKEKNGLRVFRIMVNSKCCKPIPKSNLGKEPISQSLTKGMLHKFM